MRLGRKKFLWIYFNFFNLKLGWLAIPIIGSLVTLINLEHGLAEALRAGAIGGFTGLLVTGVMTRVIQHFALWQKRIWSYFLGSGIPTGVTMIMHLTGQGINHTPELFWSVIAPTLLTFFSSIGLNFGTFFFNQHPNYHGPLAGFFKYLFIIPGRKQYKQKINGLS